LQRDLLGYEPAGGVPATHPQRRISHAQTTWTSSRRRVRPRPRARRHHRRCGGRRDPPGGRPARRPAPRRLLSGIDAHFIYSNCDAGPVTKFFNASFFQTETKLGQSGWIQINNDPHTRGFTNPGECAGWDGLFSPPMYRYWKC
jgi:hypothetical protein